VSLATAEAEETNNILHFRLKKTMRSENKQDGESLTEIIEILKLIIKKIII
jgi:hypothetical protein